MQTLIIDGITVQLLPEKPVKPLALRPHELLILRYIRDNPTVPSVMVAALHGISPQRLNTLKRKLEAAKLLPARAQAPRAPMDADEFWEPQTTPDDSSHAP
jgi:hypothetical protein